MADGIPTMARASTFSGGKPDQYFFTCQKVHITRIKTHNAIINPYHLTATEPIVKAMGIPYEILETSDGVKQIPWAMNKAKEIEGPVAILLDTMDKWGR